jgi:superoxide dismutase, Cu-Zn family
MSMRGNVHLTAIAALGMGAVALGIASAAEEMLGKPDVDGSATIKDAHGKTVGSLHVEDDDHDTTKITVSASGLPPGYHGFHIHTKGVCDPASKDPATGSPFASAGAHFDLGSDAHPNHSGDLPALLVGADGRGTATAMTGRFRVDQLFDSDGSAIIIHALPDNLAHIPDRYAQQGKPGPDAESHKTGDSGGRLACGVITKR